jgi:hypothetical protein
MWSVNRSVLVVRPRQPYLDWVHSVDEGGQNFTLADLRNDCTAYLIPEFDDDGHQAQIVEAIYEEVFEHELWAWMRDPEVWPPNRDLPTFLQWFELEYCSVTLDTVGKRITLVEE